jgi:hypothetical protein
VSHSGRCMVELPALVALILLACAAGSAQASPHNNKKRSGSRPCPHLRTTGWRLLAYVPNPNGPEPILARAFVCYDKSEESKGDPAKALAKALKKFLSDTRPVELTEDRFRRQVHPDGRTISACFACYEIIFSANDEEADIAEGVHECPPT